MKYEISSQKFNDYNSMSQSAKKWDMHCAYQLLPHALVGEHHIIELPTIQLSYSSRAGGFMHSALSPKGSISIGVIQECDGEAVFDRMKLYKGDILFFDDAKALYFMSKGQIKVAIVSIPVNAVTLLQPKLHTALGHCIRGSNDLLATTLQNILEDCRGNTTTRNTQEIEEEIIAVLTKLFETETTEIPKLTKGENTALDILEKLYGHMDAKVSISTLARQHSVSEHTLQKSFRSLFGFTPKHFLQLLKLNHVHHDLKNSVPKSDTVSRIAQKWGFSHMGRFSHDYTELFGENPSLTLKSEHIAEESMRSECASRQDEI